LSLVLDVPAQRYFDSGQSRKISNLGDEIETWAYDVATLVDDLALSSVLRDEGKWDDALRR